MGVVCLLGWVCHKLWELNETRVTSGASFDTVSLDLRKQVCKVVLRVDVHPKFIKPAYPQVEQPTGTPGMLPNAAQPSMQLWGQVVSTALCSLWNCYRFVLRQSRAVGERALGVSVNVPDVFAQLTDCMDSAQLDMNVVLDCLTSTVPEVGMYVCTLYPELSFVQCVVMLCTYACTSNNCMYCMYISAFHHCTCIWL